MAKKKKVEEEEGSFLSKECIGKLIEELSGEEEKLFLACFSFLPHTIIYVVEQPVALVQVYKYQKGIKEVTKRFKKITDVKISKGTAFSNEKHIEFAIPIIEEGNTEEELGNILKRQLIRVDYFDKAASMIGLNSEKFEKID